MNGFNESIIKTKDKKLIKEEKKKRERVKNWIELVKSEIEPRPKKHECERKTSWS